MKFHGFLYGTSAVAMMFAAAQPANAQDGGSQTESARQATDDGMIVVTAQRREQSLQDVPVSVSVVSGDLLARSNLNDLASVAERQPGIRITPGPSDQLSIRGIGSGANNSGFEQAVATFVDGVYRSRSRATRAALFDIERVEILKGPQTTYFGNNAIAGALNITTRKPGYDFEANAQALYGTYGEYNLEAGVTAPLHETLSVRLAGRLSGMDGYVHNSFTGDDGPHERNRIGRISVAFTPADNFQSDLRFDIGRLKGRNFLPFEIEHCPPADPFVSSSACAGYLAANGGRPVDDVVDHHTASPPSDLDYRFKEVTWTNELGLGDYSLNAITGYFEHDTEYFQQLIPVPVTGIGGGGQLPIFQREAFNQWSQEIRLQSPVGQFVEWQLGAYYSETELRNDGVTGFYFAPFGAQVPSYTADSPIAGRVHVSEDSTNKSVFGAATVNATDRLRVNLGLRYSIVDKDAFRSLVYGIADPIDLRPETFTPGDPAASEALNAILGSSTADFTIPSRRDKKLMPSAGLQYDLSPDITAYGSYTKGFKAGGFSGGSTGGTFEPETVDAFEVGLKGSVLDRRLTFSLAAFHSEYDDLQESVVEVLPSGSARVSVANAAAARSQGVELGLSWRLADWLTARTELAWLDATYQNYPSAPCSSIQNVLGEAAGCIDSRQDLSGKRRAFAPEYSGNFSLDAVAPVGDGMVVTITPSMYFSSWFYQSATADDLMRQSGYAKVDLRVGLGAEDESWELAFIGKNLTDHTTAGFRQPVSGGLGSVSALADRPISAAIQFTVRR